MHRCCCPIRTWNTLCEKLHEDSILQEMRKQAKKNGDVGPYTQRRTAPLKTSADMLRESNAQHSKAAAPPAGQARASRLSTAWKAVAAKVGRVAVVDAMNVFKKSKETASTSAKQVTDFPMWSEAVSQDESITSEYLAGRDLAGQAFVEVFARSNPWAVRDFDYGLTPGYAHKMGLALELIVSGATKPAALQQRLRVLALGHVQMGIKPEMLPSFEKALFEFLSEVRSHAVSSLLSAIAHCCENCLQLTVPFEVAWTSH